MGGGLGHYLEGYSNDFPQLHVLIKLHTICLKISGHFFLFFLILTGKMTNFLSSFSFYIPVMFRVFKINCNF